VRPQKSPKSLPEFGVFAKNEGNSRFDRRPAVLASLRSSTLHRAFPLQPGLRRVRAPLPHPPTRSVRNHRKPIRIKVRRRLHRGQVGQRGQFEPPPEDCDRKTQR